MENIEKHIVIQADTLEKVKKAYVNYKKSPKERLTAGYVKGRIDTLELYWKEFKVLHEMLILSIPMEQRQATNYFADNMFEEFEEAYYAYKGEMMSKLDGMVPTKTLVHVTAESGQSHVLRALVDQGSEESFATARAVELLGLKKTKISGVISGVEECETTIKHRHITSLHVTRQIEEDNNLLKRFWEVESELYTKQSMWTKEEEKCEEIYQQTTSRDETGRYVVQLPLKTTFEDTVRSCGNTKHQAVIRLEQLERKFARNEHLKAEYTRVIHEYLQLGHMKKVDAEDEGHEDLDEMKATCKEINALLKAGGFEMQKWSSNSEELLKDLVDGTKTPEPVKDKKEIKLDKIIKILGLTWDRKDDTFHVSVNLPASRIPVTKRVILSDVASLFDPFGWLSPVVITAKIMIQKLWLCHCGWDDELSSELVDEWMSFRDELHELQTVEIPRWIKMSSHCKEVYLHGFSDASTLALAAVVYARVVDEHDVVHVTMLASKTKVAPLKQLTVPKLEICAAVILAKLLHEISRLLNIPMHKIYAWTDSMVVLSWLQSPPSRWQVFVGNRVSEIIQHIDNDRWRHVSSEDNPADLASRGIRASELANNELWWSGPRWLKDTNTEMLRATTIPTTNLESKKSFHTSVQDTPIWERFSSMVRMKRVIAQCKRFLDYKTRRHDILSAAELDEVETCCVRYYQKLIYSQEFEDLKKKGKVRNKSSLIKLTPYVDEHDLLRVGGRLSKADLPEDAKHPIIVPSKQHVARLIIADAHTKTLHGTILQTMTYVRSKYWVIGLKSSVRDFTRKCIVCIKNNALTRQQLMGQLPTSRVTQNRAFYHSGVDFAGPVYLRTSKGRGRTSAKGYICLFVCMCTKAIHLEAVTDLTAQAFIAAFRRFVARRGHCAQLWSDNGTNFIGADKELRDIWSKSTNSVPKEIAELLANDGTTWHFVPPKSPNFGGLWESGVRSAKRHLLRVNGATKLTYEEFSTQLSQVEACLNSRPLCQLDDTLDTLNPLTPGHFLVREALINIPDRSYETKSLHLLTRWQVVQKQTQDFWKKWQSDYLNTLQQKHKWYDVVKSPCIGDVVIMKEQDLPPAKWLLGKITALHAGPDNLVRVVTVQCKGNHILKRPLSKLILLPKTAD
ncbi:uncharacterized protein LOC133518600 [Cydia pomonella]|uniref:uncharacterized protein LOC133518600 n=1 Tax=Cydia pomonella TaxID=82600 RepID=UPI002ADE4539|nr:uncharacterized protein LOC133518600 [Cydia pomonella]